MAYRLWNQTQHPYRRAGRAAEHVRLFSAQKGGGRKKPLSLTVTPTLVTAIRDTNMREMFQRVFIGKELTERVAESISASTGISESALRENFDALFRQMAVKQRQFELAEMKKRDAANYRARKREKANV